MAFVEMKFALGPHLFNGAKKNERAPDMERKSSRDMRKRDYL
jgi:hypothetical protein